MKQIVFIGLGAGVASALLFASIAAGSPLAFVLANFAQLPIMIAAIGWTHVSALAAIAIATAGLGLLLGTWIAFAFLIGIGLPAWWIGYLALLGRASSAPDTIEWYPIGRIVLWTSIIAACVVIVPMLRYGLDGASIQTGLRNELERALRFLVGAPASGPLQLPTVRDPERLLDILVAVIPPMKAIALTVITVLNLWLAALVVKVSGRLRRPWPVISQMSYPAMAATVLAIAVGASFLPDLIGLLSGVFAASLLFAYALLGLAVLHAITTGVGGRGFILSGVYATVILFGWPMLFVAFVGLIETMVALRARVAARRQPPATPRPPNRT